MRASTRSGNGYAWVYQKAFPPHSHDMKATQEEIQQLVTEACQHPIGSLQRQRNLTRLIRLIQPYLWRENSADYPDALQQTWIYFCQNLCEAATGERYDCDRATVVTWLNYYLKRRLQTFQHRAQIQQARRVAEFSSDESGTVLDTIAAPADVPPILDAVRDWAEADISGELRQTHIAGRPAVNCQVLILRRLPPESSWKELSSEFGVSIATLSSFYQRQCLPRLRNFGESEGYL